MPCWLFVTAASVWLCTTWHALLVVRYCCVSLAVYNLTRLDGCSLLLGQFGCVQPGMPCWFVTAGSVWLCTTRHALLVVGYFVSLAVYSLTRLAGSLLLCQFGCVQPDMPCWLFVTSSVWLCTTRHALLVVRYCCVSLVVYNLSCLAGCSLLRQFGCVQPVMPCWLFVTASVWLCTTRHALLVVRCCCVSLASYNQACLAGCSLLLHQFGFVQPGMPCWLLVTSSVWLCTT